MHETSCVIIPFPMQEASLNHAFHGRAEALTERVGKLNTTVTAATALAKLHSKDDNEYLTKLALYRVNTKTMDTFVTAMADRFVTHIHSSSNITGMLVV